jgi:hypothetical protein
LDRMIHYKLFSSATDHVVKAHHPKSQGNDHRLPQPILTAVYIK